MIDWFDLPNLTTFTTGNRSFFETTSLKLEGTMNDDWLIDWFDLPKLTTFTTGLYSFYYTTRLSLNSMMNVDWLKWFS